METAEINYRFRETLKGNFKIFLYGSVVGITLATAGFARNFYQTGNIPSQYQLKTSNSIISGMGIGIAIASFAAAIGLGVRAKRKRDSELESISNSAAGEDIDFPFVP